MAFSKAHLHDPAIYHFTLLCKALSHPARVVIVKRLIQSHERWVRAGELGEGIPLAKQTLSDHFRILREMSIISCSEHQKCTYYALNREMINTFCLIFSLASSADLKHDDSYAHEIPILNARRRLGKKPF